MSVKQQGGAGMAEDAVFDLVHMEAVSYVFQSDKITEVRQHYSGSAALLIISDTKDRGLIQTTSPGCNVP